MKTIIFVFFATLTSLVVISCKTSNPTSAVVFSAGTPTAIGTPIGTASVSTIGIAGGSLMSPDGRLELIIPAGALGVATNISIQNVSNEAPLGAGVGFSLGPNGQQFSKPITLRFYYDSLDKAGTDIRSLAVATQHDDRIWYKFNSIHLDSTTGTVSISTTHFSAYSLLAALRMVPATAQVPLNQTLGLKVEIISKAPVDSDPNDDLSPLANFETYSPASQVSWSVNGNPGGTQYLGTVSPANGSSTAIYTAPSTTKNLLSNTVGVAANVVVPGEGNFLLISNVTILGNSGVNGRISLATSVSGTVNNTLTTATESKSEEGSATFVYDLANADIDESGGSRSANWNDAGFGGSANWEEVHLTSYNYVCDNVKDRIIIDKVTTTQSFLSSGAGLQVTGVGLTIAADGSYTIVVGPSTKPAATTATKTEHSGYCINPQPDSNSNASPIPFVQYFIPYVAGGGDKLTGKINPAQPNSIKGSYHGTDQFTLFSLGTMDINIPIEYTITWDLTITK